eukprot:scaffold367_cov274-Ochromonas_danica.AAC.14
MPHAGLLKSHTVTRVNKGVKSLNAVLDVLAGASLAAHLSVASMITPPVTMTMPVAVTEVRQGMYKEYTIEKTDNAVVDNAKSGFKKVEETEENKNKALLSSLWCNTSGISLRKIERRFVFFKLFLGLLRVSPTPAQSKGFVWHNSIDKKDSSLRETSRLNQVIIWDRIIQSPEEAYIKEYNEFVKYALIDQGEELRNRTINLKLVWDHMPLTGRMYVVDEKKSSFKLPGSYKT